MLFIETFGHLRVHLGDDKPLRFVSRRAELLLVYLALTQRPHTREYLATLLWDDRDQKQSLANFRSLLARMPKAVKPFLQIERHQVSVSSQRLDSQQVVVDALAFEKRVSNAETAVALEGGLALYQGAFLHGVFVRDSIGLEAWITLMREKFGRLAATTRHRLATTYLYQRQFSAGIRHAYALVNADSLHEASQRLLLRLLAKNGQFNEAIQAFETCRAALWEEMGIEPTEQTQRLATRIQAARTGVPHVVPSAPTALVGRAAELATLNQRLDDPNCKLLTIAGMGGTGKTRLLLAIGDQRRGDYLNGIFFVPLAEIDSRPELTIARICGVTLGQTETPIEQLITFLQDKELLLLLDNVEHLVDEMAQLVQEITAAAPDVQIVVSSRERLALRMEWVVEVAGLQVAGLQSEAVQLFKSCLVRRGETGEDWAEIAAFCQLIEGNPLGIELAATTGVRRDFAALVTRMRDVPARQRSLQAVFEHSYQLLDDHLQTILGKLAVFRGAFSVAAAQSIANATSKDLHALAAKSLIRLTGDRYDLHEVIRHFSAAINPTFPQTQTIHSRYFANWLAQTLSQLRSKQQAVALHQFEQDRANIDYGWQTALTTNDWQTLDQYVTPLHDFSEIRSEFHPANSRFQAAVDRIRPLIDAQSPLHLRRLFARLLVRLGFHQERIAQYHAAQESLHEAIKWLENCDADDEQLFAVSHLGVTADGVGDIGAARGYFERALIQARRLNNERKIAHCLSQLGYLLQTAGEWTAAQIALEESVDLWRKVGGKQDLAIALNGLAGVLKARGELDAAEKIYRENIVVCQTLGDALGEVMSLKNLGDLQLRRENIPAAVENYAAAQVINAERTQLVWLDAQLAVRRGDIALLRGELAAARSDYAQSLRHCRQLSDAIGQAVSLMGLGDVERESGALETAETHLQAALELALDNKATDFALKALLLLGDVYLAAAQKESAAAIFTTCATHGMASADIRQRAENSRTQHALPRMGAKTDLSAFLKPKMAL